jgi:hypothetical protein
MCKLLKSNSLNKINDVGRQGKLKCAGVCYYGVPERAFIGACREAEKASVILSQLVVFLNTYAGFKQSIAVYGTVAAHGKYSTTPTPAIQPCHKRKFLVVGQFD